MSLFRFVYRLVDGPVSSLVAYCNGRFCMLPVGLDFIGETLEKREFVWQKRSVFYQIQLFKATELCACRKWNDKYWKVH